MPTRLSVSEATALVKSLLDEGLSPLWVEGEISNFISHGSGHFYFSLKDAHSALRCVMFRGANRRLRFTPESGQSCAVFGRLTVYERSGQYQMIVERLLPVGEGELQLAFEELKRHLDAEGLFDEAHKQKLPLFPKRIGLVTSQTGAAVRDMIKVLRRRWPRIQITLRPALVQGTGAAADIAQAIHDISAFCDIDLLIVGRGGGSLEDLWAFNEEAVVRAIYNCPVPVISAVGHEIDHTLADFAADVRAPTPSAAAEIAVPALPEQTALIRSNLIRVHQANQRKIGEIKLRLTALNRHLALQSPLSRLRQENQRTDELFQRIERSISTRLQRYQDRLQALDHQLSALNPVAILDRGFALVLNESGLLVRRAEDAAIETEIRVQLGTGLLRCRVLGHEPGSGHGSVDNQARESR